MKFRRINNLSQAHIFVYSLIIILNIVIFDIIHTQQIDISIIIVLFDQMKCINEQRFCRPTKNFREKNLFLYLLNTYISMNISPATSILKKFLFSPLSSDAKTQIIC